MRGGSSRSFQTFQTVFHPVSLSHVVISQKAHKSAEKMSSPSVQCLLVHLGPGLVADPVLIVALTGNTRLIREAKPTGFGARLSRQSFVFLSAGGSTRSHMSDPRLWEEKEHGSAWGAAQVRASWASFSSLAWPHWPSDGKRGRRWQGWPLSSQWGRLITLQPRRESMLP